jgi:hypothetical protein
LQEDKLPEMWEKMLDLHVALPVPGRAMALLDARRMLETGRVRLSDQYGGESSVPRALAECEIRASSAWLERYNSALPAGGEQLRGVEDSLAAQAEVNVERVLRKQEEMHTDVGCLVRQGEVVSDILAGNIPERAEGQSAGSLRRQLQNAKSLIDMKLRPIKEEEEQEKMMKRRRLYEGAVGLSRIDLDSLSVEEAQEKAKQMALVNNQIYKDTMARLKQRKAEEERKARIEAKEAKKAEEAKKAQETKKARKTKKAQETKKARKTKKAQATKDPNEAEGGLQGGFSNR